VGFSRVPYYIGPFQYLLRRHSVIRTLREAVRPDEAIILRGGQLSVCLLSAMKSRQPYAVEVGGDPHEVFTKGSVSHPLRVLFRWWFTRQLTLECKNARAVAYVTESVLQQRYPAHAAAFTTHYSSIDLPREAFANTPRAAVSFRRTPTLTSVGSFEQLYKGFDVLIDAVELCIRQGLDLQLILIGDGKHRQELQQYVTRLGLMGRVHFLGAIPGGAPVREQLDRSDLFVLASRTEGLPKAMLEAMSRALPCIGSAVGGIPELLDPGDLVPAGNPAALAAKILEVVRDPHRQAAMSCRNLRRSREYSDNVLAKRRRLFYEYVRDLTQDWKARQTECQSVCST
jgi:glycosyltransferase involved in cell wall biosynthesis